MLRLIFVLMLLGSTAYSQQSDLFKQLAALPDVVEVTVIKADSMFKEAYELRVRQPLDHHTPQGKTFLQSVYLAHVDFGRPVMFETEGYAARGGGRPRELTTILKSNQIVVEHRFFGKSVPDSMEWRYLTTRQAAEDHHHIVMLLKRLYKGKWISSGTSKGGETTLFYRYYFPEDVDVCVPYVAPVNLSQEDPRIQHFMRNVGTPEQRQRIKEFQTALLKREKEILPWVDTLAEKRKYTFSLGKTMAYEYSVLEYPCALWQYGTPPDSIPSPASPPEVMLAHLDKVSTLFYYADQGIKAFEPFQYQAYTEIGYYGYDITDFKELLTAITNPTNIVLAPRNTDLTFNPSVMYNVYTWLRDHGSNIIYIYGENDLWSATAMELAGKTNAIKVVQPGGSHRVRIRTLTPDQQKLVYGTLENWLGMKIGQ
jgi:hypothetical protein